MNGSFLFLGTGASAGIPVIGCTCSVCNSSDPHNQRLRPAGLLTIGDKRFLIDIGPDFRQQFLKYKMSHLDGLLLTHTHYDHIAGVDELRVFNVRYKRSFPCLLSKESLIDLQSRYSYLFKARNLDSSYATELHCQVLEEESGLTDFCGIKFGYTSYTQGGMKVTGFRVGSFAYISDIREYGEDIFPFLKGVEHLVLSALRFEPSLVHFSMQEAVTFSEKAGARQTWLTHLSHAIDHETTCRLLPPSVQPGFDGLELTFSLGPRYA